MSLWCATDSNRINYNKMLKSALFNTEGTDLNSLFAQNGANKQHRRRRIKKVRHVQYDCKFLLVAYVQYDCKFLLVACVQYDCKFLLVAYVQ